MSKPTMLLVLALLLCITLAAPASALDADEVTLPSSLTVAGQAVVLNGTGLRVAYGLVDVYVAGLYLPTKTSSDVAALSMGGAKYMSMTFVRDVDGEDICDAWVDGVEDNVATEMQGLEERMDALCKATPDIEEGRVMAYAYDPRTSETVFTIDGQTMATIAGRDFYDALLSCWIGPDPGPGDDFKEDLLGLD